MQVLTKRTGTKCSPNPMSPQVTRRFLQTRDTKRRKIRVIQDPPQKLSNRISFASHHDASSQCHKQHSEKRGGCGCSVAVVCVAEAPSMSLLLPDAAVGPCIFVRNACAGHVWNVPAKLQRARNYFSGKVFKVLAILHIFTWLSYTL